MNKSLIAAGDFKSLKARVEKSYDDNKNEILSGNRELGIDRAANVFTGDEVFTPPVAPVQSEPAEPVQNSAPVTADDIQALFRPAPKVETPVQAEPPKPQSSYAEDLLASLSGI